MKRNLGFLSQCPWPKRGVVWLWLFLLPLYGSNVVLDSSLSSLAMAKSLSEVTAQEMQTLKQSQQQWIEVNVTTQRLIAWKGDQPVYAVIISTGKSETPTLTGVFSIQVKRRQDRMRGDDYDVPNVPYVMYYDRGYAIHGAYWHNNFGTPMSHGCINLAVNHAQWLFEWASRGTPVVIHQ